MSPGFIRTVLVPIHASATDSTNEMAQARARFAFLYIGQHGFCDFLCVSLLQVLDQEAPGVRNRPQCYWLRKHCARAYLSIRSGCIVADRFDQWNCQGWYL